MGQMTIHGLASLRRQPVEEAFDQGRLADTAGTGDHAQFTHRKQELQPGQTFLHARVLPQGGGRGVLGERLTAQSKMVEIHQESPEDKRD